MSLARHIDTLSALSDESRLRLCALLFDRELNVSDLVRVTGIAQSRVSTHLGRLRDAGIVRDRRQGAQSFYGVAKESLSPTVREAIEEARSSNDPTLANDQRRLRELDQERRNGPVESVADEVERSYSPGRTWQSLAIGIAALLDLGDVLDAGCGTAAAAALIAPYCRGLTCIDTDARAIEVARRRFAKQPHVRVEVADIHALPFEDASFDTVLVFHTLTHAEHPGRALRECARALRPGGRLVVLCLDQHEWHEVTARYGELRPGHSPAAVRSLLTSAGLTVRSSEVAVREARKPHFQVVRAIAIKPDRETRASSPKRRAG